MSLSPKDYQWQWGLVDRIAHAKSGRPNQRGLYSWNPNGAPRFEKLTFKNRGHLGSRLVLEVSSSLSEFLG